MENSTKVLLKVDDELKELNEQMHGVAGILLSTSEFLRLMEFDHTITSSLNLAHDTMISVFQRLTELRNLINKNI